MKLSPLRRTTYVIPTELATLWPYMTRTERLTYRAWMRTLALARWLRRRIRL